eukprot:TRINITY_DN8625_c1_g1_i12.p1 TRINITY_DN8625_c1_g1~~TRINITY_DN8625_c1_g1_i12.p1  ORF type:complete len:355 (+),score=27.07 TRINITY_DN8625_c1_g1_i12:74-1066(+)
MTQIRTIMNTIRPVSQFAHNNSPLSCTKQTGFRTKRNRYISIRQITMSAQEQKQEQGHQVDKGSVYSEQQMDPEIEAFRKHQQSVPKPTPAEASRSIVKMSSYGILSTLGSEEGVEGFPIGTSAQYAIDTKGRPIFCISTLASHTKDLMKDPKGCLSVQVPYFKSLADGRVSLIGNIKKVSEEELEECKKVYSEAHPKAFWINFGDFSLYKMEKVLKARFIGGFGWTAWVEGEDYENAAVDPICEFTEFIVQHMNDDHSESIKNMVKHYVGITVENAKMYAIDRLGFSVICERDGESFKCRVPFPTPVENRQEVRNTIINMSRASRGVQV